MKFMADRTVGKLVKILRLLGYDVRYWPSGSRDHPAEILKEEGRILLTRSQRLAEEMGDLRVVAVQANDPREQVKEVLEALQLRPEEEGYFSRCLLCNEELEIVAKEGVEGRVPDFIYQSYDTFHACPSCRRIYWPGSHLQRMKKELEKIVGGIS